MQAWQINQWIEDVISKVESLEEYYCIVNCGYYEIISDICAALEALKEEISNGLEID